MFILRRLRYLLVFGLSIVVISGSADALEKTGVRATDQTERSDSWQSAGTCTIAYYNVCTGWVWVWWGWSPGDRYGVCFTTCCSAGQTVIDETCYYCFTASPPGYSFTGVVETWNADLQRCPSGVALASQVHLPTSGWNRIDFGGMAASVAGTFVITYTAGSGIEDPHGIGSDHPDAGPTGPTACGTCYPNPRTTYSFYYGTQTSPLCPGEPLFDGVCNAEWLWYCDVYCVTSVKLTSWSRMKALYR